jgi:hypothetical protein
MSSCTTIKTCQWPTGPLYFTIHNLNSVACVVRDSFSLIIINFLRLFFVSCFVTLLVIKEKVDDKGGGGGEVEGI